jgi:imidazolonepropionase-like amidohydrolase
MDKYILIGRVIDAVSDQPLEQGMVIISGERLEYVGPWRDDLCSSEDQVIQCENGTILPGFIDCHAHLTGQQNAGSFANGTLFGDQLLGAVYQLGLLLDAGFTGLRDMSEAGLYLSRGVERGAIRGPRIVPGGRVLGITSGHVDLDPSISKEAYNASHNLAYLMDGVDECIAGVREQFRRGARFIKVCATGGVSSPLDHLDDVQFSQEELEATVAEAKRHHTYVAAHCTGSEGAYAALKAGVTSIEHGVMLTQREIDLMAEMDATLVTTLAVSLGVANIPGLPDWMAKKAKMCAEANIRTIEMARKAGIRIALGTDFSNSRNSPYLQNGAEFRAMVQAGMTPMEAIRAGTINAAHLMMMEDEIGSLEIGKLADVVLVEGNPLEDIKCLTDARFVKVVLKNGVMEKNTIGKGEQK